MKPTQIQCSEGSVNQIPPWTEIKGEREREDKSFTFCKGDIRLTPFYDANECVKKMKSYVEELNKGIKEKKHVTQSVYNRSQSTSNQRSMQQILLY